MIIKPKVSELNKTTINFDLHLLAVHSSLQIQASVVETKGFLIVLLGNLSQKLGSGEMSFARDTFDGTAHGAKPKVG